MIIKISLVLSDFQLEMANCKIKGRQQDAQYQTFIKNFMSFGTSSIVIGNAKFVCRAAEHFTIYWFDRSREVL